MKAILIIVLIWIFVEAQFGRRSGPVVAQTVRDGRRTLEQAKSYMEGNAKFLKRQANQSTVFIFDNDTQHIRFLCLIQALKIR